MKATKFIFMVLLVFGFVSMNACTSAQEIPTTATQVEDGYILFNPQGSTTTYLISNDGKLVHSWESNYKTGNSVYLLENGNLLRTANVRGKFGAEGAAGRVEEFSWDGDLLWSYEYSSETVLFHHDLEPLPNGNVLLVAWERISKEDSLAAGRDSSLIPTGTKGKKDTSLWMDHIVEVNKQGEIVWEWHVADHLVQDYDKTKANYGIVADHPEKININYLGTARVSNDWNHVNAIDYNADLDQIMISCRNFSEIWVINHNTTTKEASESKGDLLYRWGNPAAYDCGTPDDQQFFSQHDAIWIQDNLPGAGNIMVFNNGNERGYSSIDEITPSINSDGTYNLTNKTFEPKTTVWHYQATNPTDFYSDHISGAQRLANGNTFVCSGADGKFFEINANNEVIWEYQNSFKTISPATKKESYSVFRAEKYLPDYPGLSKLK